MLCAEDELLRWSVLNGPPTEAAAQDLPVAFAYQLADVLRAVEVEKSRAGSRVLGEYEGLLGPGLSAASRRTLEGLTERAFSVSQLETYRTCPFRFLASRLLRLNAAGDLEEALSPIERGSLLHEALFEFHLSRRSRELPDIARCSDREFQEAVEELSAIVQRLLEQMDIPDAFWELDREMLTGGPGTRQGIIREYLESERGREVRSSPGYFEAAFGDVGGSDSRRDPLLCSPEPLRLGAIRVRGKIDRIDVGDDFFTVVDYKSGKKIPEMDDILQGRSLQLPLYIAAVRQLLQMSDHPNLAPAGGVYYLLRRPVRAATGLGAARFNGAAFTAAANSRRLVPDEVALLRLTEQSIAFAEEAVAGMSRGLFPLAAPEAVESVCPYCDFRAMCRIQAARHVHTPSAEET